MPRPVLHRPTTTEWEGEGIAYRLDGALTPVLHLIVTEPMPVYFEHHLVLWKDPEVHIGLHKTKRGYRRSLAGMSIYLAETLTAGELALSRDSAGQIVPLHMPGGMSIFVREHQFLAATATLDHSFERVRGTSALFAGSNGFSVDRFDAFQDGILWLHGYGDVFHIELDAGEALDVDPGAWLYREARVGMEQQSFGLRPGLLTGSSQLVFNRFTGPGTVGIQSMYQHLPAPDR